MTLRVVRPLIKLRMLSGAGPLPILMYHRISDDPEPGVSPYYKTNTSPAVFEQHMQRLSDEGFRSVDLDEAFRILREKPAKKEKIVVITFDDGFRDFYDVACPIMKKRRQTATMYLPTGFISGRRKSFHGNECMTWNEVRELRKAGMRFGSHTVNHPKLYDLSWKEIESELSFSKVQIERELGEQITEFAYPYAFPQQDPGFTRKFSALMQGLGYKNCVTTIIGRARCSDDAYRLKRLPVNACDDETLFAAKLTGAYDWLAHPQCWSKTVRHWTRRSSSKSSEARSATRSSKAQKSPQDSRL